MTTTATGRSPVPLEYTDSGTGSPLILIMGLNADATAWLPHTSQWQQSFRCIAVDNPGAGRSPSPPGPYTTAEIAEDYAALIGGLDLGPVAVVGISMGGAIAQELVLRHPNLVRRLVLVATWASCDTYTKAVLEVIGALRQHGDDALFTAHLQTLVWTPQWFDRHVDELVAQRQEPLSVDPTALEAQVSACQTHHASGRLASVGIPTLVTAGGVDRFVPIEVSQALAQQIPNARFELFAQTGHVHHWEELERFNNLVEEWLHG